MADEPEAQVEVDVDVLLYPATVSVAEQRRAFVLEHLANGEIDGHILAINCDILCRWLETGCVPEQPRTKKGSATALKTV